MTPVSKGINHHDRVQITLILIVPVIWLVWMLSQSASTDIYRAGDPRDSFGAPLQARQSDELCRYAAVRVREGGGAGRRVGGEGAGLAGGSGS